MGVTIKVMLNMDRKSATGLYPLVIRVIKNRRKKLIYTPYKLPEYNFNHINERAVWSDSGGFSQKQIKEINRFVDTTVSQLERIIHNLTVKFRDDFSAGDISVGFGRSKTDRQFNSFVEKEIEARIRTNRFGTATLYRTTRESLIRFTNGKKLLFTDITYKFLSDYTDYLREHELSENSVRMYLRNIRSIYNKAQKEGVVISRTTPFSDIKMSVMPTIKRALDRDTIRKIAYLDLSTNSELEQARDVFMFSFYNRGMSFVDMLYLRHSNIQDGVIYYVRNKTNQNMQIKITAPLLHIINKYNNGSIYILPFLNEGTNESLYKQYRNALTRINNNLKQIGGVLGLDMPLTTYVARHSWATIAKSNGAPISAISEGLGHTTEKTTQIYLRAFDRKVIDEINDKIVLL